MSKKLKAAVFFGLGMTFIFCTMSIVDIIKGEDETTSEIIRSFIAAFIAGIAVALLTYIFYDKLNMDRMFKRKSES